MRDTATSRGWEFYAETYDVCVPDWPGEIDFYRELASEATAKGQGVLELACGTGRIAIRLAREGARIVGLDLSEAMIEIARKKAEDAPNARWVAGDMRSFDLGERFGLVIVPGHAFQNLTTADDQLACLERVGLHLSPDGLLALHVDNPDLDWLGELAKGIGTGFEPAEEFVRPSTGNRVRTSRAWSYERSTQTATCETSWEELAPDGTVIDRWETGPARIHCVFRFEMEHLLARTGFAVDRVCGGFDLRELAEDSSEMIWMARRKLRRER